MKEFSKRKIERFIKKIQQQKILVLGDLMLDRFIWGRVDRISPEAPVPVVHVTHDSAYPGGAANVARNLSDFGIPVTVGGIIGNDDNGTNLEQLLQSASISTHGILKLPNFPTIVKTRIIARHQQVVRVDREEKRKLKTKDLQQLLPSLKTLINEVNAIILQDYSKGFITQELVDEIILLAKENNTIIAVDPNPHNWLKWSGVSLMKPNRQEAYAAAGIPYDDDEKSLIEIGQRLLDKWNISYLLITLGEEGMILFHPPDEPYHIPTKAREVYDVSGAGDTVIAFFTAALAVGLSGAEAAEIANHAAGIVIGKVGTATLKPEELIKSYLHNE